MAKFLQNYVYEEPSSIYITAMSGMTLLLLAYLGISETIGKHLRYSKFWNVNSGGGIKLSSRTGMLILYSPAAFAGLASFVIFPGGGIRFLMLKLAITVHFSKRVLETLFVHKYSGGMVLDSVIVISLSYFFGAAGMICIHHMALEFVEPLVDLKYLGLLLFVVGISGNFYHHYLLSNLRKENEKGYKIPTGGLFNLVICPHYLFEILGFLGIAFISQTLFSYSCAIGSALYLLGRSYATRKWPSFALMYPLCASICAIENDGEFSYQPCLKYWVLFYITSILKCMFPEVILRLPFWPYATGTASLLLAVPYFHGASYVYKYYLRPYITGDSSECDNLHIPKKRGDTSINQDEYSTPFAFELGSSVTVQREIQREKCFGIPLVSASGDECLRNHLQAEKQKSKLEELRRTELMASEIVINSTITMRSSGMVLVDSSNQITRTNFERPSGLISPETRSNKGCMWKKPKLGWTKLNTDGSIYRENARFGGLFRDYKGDPICAYVSKASIDDTFLVELWAIWRGLVLAKGLGIKLVWVESDSLSVVKTINKEQQYGLKAGSYLKNIWKLIKKFEKCKVSHSWRESNRAADHLSKMSVLGNDIVLWPADFPNNLMKIIKDDAQGRWYRRG